VCLSDNNNNNTCGGAPAHPCLPLSALPAGRVERLEPLLPLRQNLWVQAGPGDPDPAGPPVPVPLRNHLPRDLGDQRVPGEEEEVSR